ncbi:hypothetical protein DL764_003429 [Monosporascus ibericus]|uniref:Cryptochrome DASH n=1 Tax=Monosporascus ibericus TaxID=155417 RepID=A0A4Q4TIC0_9PEZI|nr:hypothetical protein DL764_003429 [Monosporascus ibericus]
MRVSDNPILHKLSTSSDHGFTHLLPLFIFLPQQVEISGLLRDGHESPYPEAKSALGRFWRCGPHRAKFIAKTVWNLKENLEKLGSDLTIRAGALETVLRSVIVKLREKQFNIGAVWMVEEEGDEEKKNEAALAEVCSKAGIDFHVWLDEKYFIDDRDTKLACPQDLPDVYTTYRKLMEPLREKPRRVLATPEQGSLPSRIEQSDIVDWGDPFGVPSSYEKLEEGLLAPLKVGLPEVPPFPEGAISAHPFEGGEDNAQKRLQALIKSGHANTYNDTRNGLLGPEFSTKLSAYLAQGCITARQVHEALLAFEDGRSESFAGTEGYGEGENEGTKTIRFELLWRDYMRLCTKKFKSRLFYQSGFRDDYGSKWKSPKPKETTHSQSQPNGEIEKTLKRLFAGTTGMGLIDASQRELVYTGYTPNRARQNVASFLAKHLNIDWRYGAEWYEMLLVDYDVNSNWANWQYMSGVGNDPRGEARIFNPVKQGFEYDKEGAYVKRWVSELRGLERLENIFQAWTTPEGDRDRLGLAGLEMVENPVKKIDFVVEGKPKNPRRPFNRRRGRGRGGGGGAANGCGCGGLNGQRHPAATVPQRPTSKDHRPYGPAGNFMQYNNTNGNSGDDAFRGGGGANGDGYRGGWGYSGRRADYRGGGYRGGRGGGGGPWQHNSWALPHRQMQQWPPPMATPR